MFMKFALALLLLCNTAQAASAEFLAPPVELADVELARTAPRPVKSSALAIIQSRLETRAATLGNAFPAEHIRHTLGNGISTQFNSALDAYKTADSDEAADLALRTLGLFCIEQELQLFKLQNTRVLSDAAIKTYSYDVATLRTILDFAQTEGPALPERVLLGALKVVDDCLKTEDFVEYLDSINAEDIFPSLQHHALIAYTKEVTKDNISQLITKLCKLPSY